MTKHLAAEATKDFTAVDDELLVLFFITRITKSVSLNRGVYIWHRLDSVGILTAFLWKEGRFAWRFPWASPLQYHWYSSYK